MIRPFSPRSLIVGFAAAAMLLLLALSGFAAYEVDRHARALAWVKHSDIVVGLLNESRLQIEFAETARQTFLTTGAAAPRAAVLRAAESVRSNAEALQQMTADNPPRARNAEELATLSAAIRSSVETSAHGGAPREGSPSFMRAESLARSMVVGERELQAQRDARERQSIDFALAALGSEVLFALALASATLWLILRGIDEREGLIVEMRRPLTMMQTVLDHVQAAISLVDLNGRVIFVNKEYARLTGVRPDAAVGRLLPEFMPLKEAAVIMAENKRVHASGSPASIEIRFPGSDGTRIYLSRKTPLPASGNRPPSVCSIVTDITGVKPDERRAPASLGRRGG